VGPVCALLHQGLPRARRGWLARQRGRRPPHTGGNADRSLELPTPLSHRGAASVEDFSASSTSGPAQIASILGQMLRSPEMMKRRLREGVGSSCSCVSAAALLDTGNWVDKAKGARPLMFRRLREPASFHKTPHPPHSVTAADMNAGTSALRIVARDRPDSGAAGDRNRAYTVMSRRSQRQRGQFPARVEGVPGVARGADRRAQLQRVWMLRRSAGIRFQPLNETVSDSSPRAGDYGYNE
jgi:hypothetical protein